MNKQDKTQNTMVKETCFNIMQQILRSLGLDASRDVLPGLEDGVKSEVRRLGGLGENTVVVDVHEMPQRDLRFMGQRVYGAFAYADIVLSLPRNSAPAISYVKHVVESEGFDERQIRKYVHVAPTDSRMRKKIRIVISRDTVDEVAQSIDEFLVIAKPFVEHLPELPEVRIWADDDGEVVAKACEIVENAELCGTRDGGFPLDNPVFLVTDKKSFAYGEYLPLRKKFRVSEFCENAAATPGTFEYAVCCALTKDKRFLAKVIEACGVNSAEGE